MAQLPTDRTLRFLLVVAFTDAAGRGAFLAGSVLFYTQVLKLSTGQVGIGLSLAALGGLVCSVPIGRLADRIGDRWALIGLQLWRATGFAIYPLVSNFTEFVVVACFIGMVEVAVGPVLQSAAGSASPPNELVRTMAMVAVVRNMAYGLAALCAAVVIASTPPSAYVDFVRANVVAFLLSVVLLLSLRLPPRPVIASVRPGLSPLSLRDKSFIAISLANGVLYLHIALLSVVLPLWIVTKTEAPRFLVGLALLVNTVMAITLQVRLSRGGDDLRRASQLQRRSGWALAAFCVLAAASGLVQTVGAALLLILAIIALSLGEMWQSAGAWGVSYGLSPPGQRTYYLSVFNLGATGIAVIGPGLLAVAVVEQGTPGWAVLGLIFATAGVLVPRLVRRTGRVV